MRFMAAVYSTTTHPGLPVFLSFPTGSGVKPLKHENPVILFAKVTMTVNATVKSVKYCVGKSLLSGQ